MGIHGTCTILAQVALVGIYYDPCLDRLGLCVLIYSFVKLLVPFFTEKPVPKVEIYLRFIGSLTKQCIGRGNFSHTNRGGGERSLASFAYKLLLRVFDVSSALLFFAFETKSQVQHYLQDFHSVLIISKSN